MFKKFVFISIKLLDMLTSLESFKVQRKLTLKISNPSSIC